MGKRRRDAQRAGRGRRGLLRTFWKVGALTAVVVLAVLALRAAGVFEPTLRVDGDAGKFGVATGEVVGTKVAPQGATHIPDGQRFTYNTTPPTSGPHWQTPTSWGIKDNQEPNERTTHNLEHGGIVIAYSSSLAPEELTKLKALVRGLGTTYRKVVLEPYAQLSDAKVALTAWSWILKLSEYDEVQIVKFVKAHYESSDAPEPKGF